MLKPWDHLTLLEPMTLLKDYGCDPIVSKPPVIANILSSRVYGTPDLESATANACTPKFPQF